MFKKLIHKIVGNPTQKFLDSLLPTVEEVNELEARFQPMTDDELRNYSQQLRERHGNGESLDELLPEAYALVRETSRRTTGMRHYDVQIMGGILLHRGEVVEMRTGEGKTLVATLPLYLNAMTGRGVHLVTVNDYLARRDGGWMGKIFHALGFTVACIGPQKFSAIYDPDYVNPGAELEDERLVHWHGRARRGLPCGHRLRHQQRVASTTCATIWRCGPRIWCSASFYYAIIDEVDNVLIDEARTPLIISGPAGQSGQDYVRFAQYVRNLRPNTAPEDAEPNGHYEIDEKSRSISLTELGISEIERRVPEVDTDAGQSLYDPRFFHLTYYLDNALKAQYLFHRDKQYVVQDGQVIIVDDFTGRLMPGRRYSDGLHEAIEAKEGVQVKRETVTVATITLQNYFRLYEKLAGMTGTAMTDAEEFGEIYGLDVTPLPTNVEYIVNTGKMDLEERRLKVNGAEQTYYSKPENGDRPVFFKRLDYPDQVYSSEEAKDRAIIDEIIAVREMGRPVLVGTTSVEHSETIHRLLERKKIPHKVLNAKQHDSEALIVAQAGRRGAVTISTNMAGRGTDILLGGNPEGMAAEMLENEMFSRSMLVQLATKLVVEGEAEARNFAAKQPRLTVDLVDSLLATKAEYDAALAESEEIR